MTRGFSPCAVHDNAGPVQRDSGSVINQKVAYARIQGWPRSNSRRATFAQSMRGLRTCMRVHVTRILARQPDIPDVWTRGEERVHERGVNGAGA